MKRTKRAVNVAMLAACLSTARCGGDASSGPADSKDGGQGGAGGSHASGSSGMGGSGFGGVGGFGGFPIPDSGSDPHDCPAQRPVDSSPCSNRNTCRYPDGVCSCVRSTGGDASSREWNCFDIVPRDAAVCPHDPHDGDMCMTPGLKCAGMQGSICACEAGDGGQEWHC